MGGNHYKNKKIRHKLKKKLNAYIKNRELLFRILKITPKTTNPKRDKNPIASVCMWGGGGALNRNFAEKYLYFLIFQS